MMRLRKGNAMWTETNFVVAAGQDKLARYREEVNWARMLRRAPLRNRLAQTLRGWAEWLEPTPRQSLRRVDSLPAERAH